MKSITWIGTASFLGALIYWTPVPANSDALRAAGVKGFGDKEAKCLLSGQGQLNLKEVSYSLYELIPDSSDPCDWVDMSGWREIDGPFPFLIGSDSRWQMRLFASGSRRLMLASNLDEPGLLGAAFFQSEDIFNYQAGDSPGRDPGQWPRPANCRRILHVVGNGIEAAWYRAGESAAGAIRLAGRSFSSAGWEIALFGDAVLCARGKDGGEVALFSSQDNEGTYLIVTSVAGAR